METEIKDCPFCGAVPKLIGSNNGPLISGWYIVCDSCGSGTRYFEEKDSGRNAIDTWNQRVPPI